MSIYELPANQFLEMSNYSRTQAREKKARHWVRRSTAWMIACGILTLWFVVFGTISLHDHGPDNANTIADFVFVLLFGFLTGMYLQAVLTWRKLLSDAREVTSKMSFEVSWITFLLSGPIGDPLMSQDRR